MTIEEYNKFDGLGLSKDDGKVVLLISDNLGWDDEDLHYYLIERKIINYLGCIESGQLSEQLGSDHRNQVRIELITENSPSTRAKEFLFVCVN